MFKTWMKYKNRIVLLNSKAAWNAHKQTNPQTTSFLLSAIIKTTHLTLLQFFDTQGTKRWIIEIQKWISVFNTESIILHDSYCEDGVY